ncbi:MAG: DNA polymerase domain-containing protein [Nanoarchaeota archaeon]
MKVLTTPYIYGKGLEIYQSSTTKCAKNLLNEILEAILLKDSSISEIKSIILKYKKMILNREITDPNQLTIVKKIGQMPETYAKTLPAHVELALKRKELGERFFISQKVPFLVLREKPLKIVHLNDYAGEYDEKYYWTKMIFPPTYRLLTIVFPDENWDRFLSTEKHYQNKLFEYEKK